MSKHYDLVIIGAGIAGLHCAGEAAQAGLACAIFEAQFIGGLVLNVNELHDCEAAGLSGMEHAALLARANATAGVASLDAEVTTIEPVDAGFEIRSAAETCTARAVVLATGARRRALGVANEAEFEGSGLSWCADCDGPLFAGQHVVVVGSSEWAAHEALVLTEEAASVRLVHQSDALALRPQMVERLQAEPKIRVLADTVVEAILGKAGAVTGIRVRDAGGTRELACTGIFPMTGLDPASELAPPAAQRDEHGALVTSEALETAQPGLYAIGLVRSGFGGWLDDAAQDARRVVASVRAHLEMPPRGK